MTLSSQPADTSPTRFGSGQSVRRLEDDALLAGAGQFTADVHPPQQAQLFFLRSPYPHARIASLDCSQARAMPGVLHIVTGAEMVAADLKVAQRTAFLKAHGHDVATAREVG